MSRYWLIGAAALGLVLATSPAPASATTITLGFNSLPSAQGFSGGTCAGSSESSLFSVNGTALHQDTTACDSQSGAGYSLSNVVTSGAFTLTATFRNTSDSLLREGDFGHFGIGFGAEANGFEYFIGIGSGVIDAITNGGGNDQNDTTVVTTTADTADFATYEIVASGTGAFSLLLNGVDIFDGQGDPIPLSDNALLLGDESSRAHAVGDFTQYVYQDGVATGVAEPATLALFGMGLAGLGVIRRRQAA
jgi:hypothetical protein